MVLFQLAKEEILLVLELLRAPDVLEDKLVEGGPEDFPVRREQSEGLLESIVQCEVTRFRVVDDLWRSECIWS